MAIRSIQRSLFMILVFPIFEFGWIWDENKTRRWGVGALMTVGVDALMPQCPDAPVLPTRNACGDVSVSVS